MWADVHWNQPSPYLLEDECSHRSSNGHVCFSWGRGLQESGATASLHSVERRVEPGATRVLVRQAI